MSSTPIPTINTTDRIKTVVQDGNPSFVEIWRQSQGGEWEQVLVIDKDAARTLTGKLVLLGS